MERYLFRGLFLVLFLNVGLLFAINDNDPNEEEHDGLVEKAGYSDLTDDIEDNVIDDFSIEEAYIYELGLIYETSLIEKSEEEKNDDIFYTEELKSIIDDELLDCIASPMNANVLKLIQKRKIPLFTNEYVEKQIEHLTVKKREFVSKSLKRAQPYIKEMKKVFKEFNIPDELAYLPLIESGFVNGAKSNKGATGMWQFMPGTAKWMGMKMDSFIDERRDPVISCFYAAKFLNFLYEKFGDWHLVLAAYNHGGRNILNEMKKAKTNYFYDLVKNKISPRETRDYVPRFVASIMVIKSLEKYGFEEIDESSDFVYYKLPFSVPAFVVAKHSNMKVDEFMKLNPALKDGYIPDPKYNYNVRLPKNNYDQLLENFDNLEKDANLCYVPYYIKQGDTLSAISVKYGLSVAFILKINNIKNPNRLSLGQKIFIPLRGYQIVKAK